MDSQHLVREMVQVYSACVPPRPVDRYIQYARRKLGIARKPNIIRDISRSDALHHRYFPISTNIVLGNQCNLRCRHCFTSEAIISGPYVPIGVCKQREKITGVSGIENPIKKIFVHPYDGPIQSVKAIGLVPVKVTPEHPFLVVSRRQNGSFTKPYWKAASKLAVLRKRGGGDMLVIPRVRGTKVDREIDLSCFTTTHGLAVAKAKGYPGVFPLNKDTALLLGIYIAEGSPNSTGVRFSLGKGEHALRRELCSIIRELGYRPNVSCRRTTVVIEIQSRILSRALPLWCGNGSANKRIPDFILSHKNTNLLRYLMLGYWKGGGHIVGHEKRYMASTVSRILALQIQFGLGRLGFFLSIFKQTRKRFAQIEGRHVHERPTYAMSYFPFRKAFKGRVLKDMLLAPVHRITTSHYRGKVYNLETNDQTYLANNILVHNCPYHGPTAPRFFTAPTEMSWDIVDRLIRELAQHKLYAKFGAYDEPLFYWHKFAPLAIALGGQGVGVHLTTNGTLMRGKFETMAKLRTIYVSVDALSQESYTAIRGSDLSMVRENVLELAKRFEGTQMGVSFIRQNDKEEQGFIDYWLPKVGMVILYAYLDFSKDNYVIREPFLASPPHRVVCSSPWLETYVLPNGDVTACCQTLVMTGRDKVSIFGNIKDQSIEAIWNGPTYQAFRRALIEEDWSNAEMCHHCPLWAASWHQVEYRDGLKITRNPTTTVIERGA